LAELLEEFHIIRERYWCLSDDQIIGNAKKIAQQTSFEFENATSEDIWKLITGNLAAAENAIVADINDITNQNRDKILAGLLMAQVGAAEWNNLSEQERQRKITQTPFF